MHIFVPKICVLKIPESRFRRKESQRRMFDLLVQDLSRLPIEISGIGIMRMLTTIMMTVTTMIAMNSNSNIDSNT